MFRLTTIAGLALAVLAAQVPAQDVIPYNGPVKYARHDMATGFTQVFENEPVPGPGDSEPSVLWSNANIGTSFSTGAGNAIVTNHHMAWGTATFLGAGATITEIRIAYATSILASEGTVIFNIRIYDGATGFGNKGTLNPNGNLIVSGLPNSVSGGFEAYVVDVTLGTPITLADGAFGYSYNSDTTFTNGTTKVTGPMLCIAPAGPGLPNAYDRYLESTNAYVNTFSFAAPNVATFCMRLVGRAIGAPPNPWVNYGTKQKVTLTGEGSATPGSVDNVISVKVNPAGKSFILVAGLTQADFFQPSIGLHFYAFPWLVQLAPIVTPPASGQVDLPAAFPGDVPVGTKIYMQAFGQNLSNNYVNWSEGLEVTIQ